MVQWLHETADCIRDTDVSHCLNKLPRISKSRETDHVPDHCSCGAELPPDAKFCHKCGKPQFELPAIEESPLPVVEQAEAKTELPPEVNFRNRVAVRIALLSAALASLLISLPMPMLLNVIWIFVSLVGAGFFAVYLYNRKTGVELTSRIGARLGWMTGIFCFVIATIFFTITVIAVSMQGGLAAFYSKQMGAEGVAKADVEQFLQILESPSGLATILLFSILLLFVFFALLPTLGGAMGAKVLGNDE